MGKRKKTKTQEKETPIKMEVVETETGHDRAAKPESESGGAVKGIETLQKEKEALFDQFLRLKAEFENYKKRTQRDMQDRVKFAEEGLLRGLLPVLDSLDRAFEQPVPESDAAVVWEGLDSIRQQFHDVLRRAGLEMVESVGTKFDPNVHEALFTVPSDEHEEHTVVNELERGYALRGKVIRPTKVAVSVPTEEKDENESNTPEESGAENAEKEN
jgi:molecular chaperone GrpE